jgi:bifunctional DNA-binding transcriptional regulator/antitoxin component of YhaV-PrlF toxin-antitoxin module
MKVRQLSLSKARSELGRLARKNGLAPGDMVEITRRGAPALVVQRAEDYARTCRKAKGGAARLWGSIALLGDLEEASRIINARLQRSWAKRAAR